MSLKENAGAKPAPASAFSSPSPPEVKPPRPGLDWKLAGVLGLALLVRLYAWWQAPSQGFVIDEAEYYQIASILADGRGWAFYEDSTWVRPPLYVMLLAGVFKFFGPNLIVVRLAQVFLSTASVYLLYRLAGRAFGRRTGLISGLLAAVAWPFAVLSYLLLSETLFIFLFLAAVNLLADYLTLARSEARPPGRQRRALLLAGAGGALLGLSALTRGQVLSFVPFVGLWLWFETARNNRRRTLVAFGVVVAVFGLVIAPWTARNFSVYGRPFIDTTGGYNFYLGALHGRNGALVSQTLEAVRNHAERETLGYRKGLEILAKDPLNFAAKGFKESLDFWNINFGADERLEDGYTQGVISPAWLIPDQLLGDTLYLLAGTLALAGLAAARYRPLQPSNGLRSFVIIWAGYNLALAFVFFAVSRFRLPVYYFMLPFAAYALAHPRQTLEWFRAPLLQAGRRGALRRAAGLLLPLIFLLIVLPTYVPGQTVIGLQEWSNQRHAERGDELRRAGQYQAALAEYAQASQRLPATQIGTGLTEALLGRYDAAIGRIGRTSQDIAQSHLALGWIYLRRGQEDFAHGEFRTRQVALDPQADRWAWDNLPVGPLPANRLQIGEFDWGYVQGFHIYEKESAQPGAAYFRWTAGRGQDGREPARLRFPLAEVNRPARLLLHLNGFRPASLTPPSVEVRANGRLLGALQTTRAWQTYNLALPPDFDPGPGREIIIELLPSSTFVPGAQSRRELGVMLQWAQLV